MSPPPEEYIIHEGRIRMPYNWAVGETGTFFLTKLRDQGRLWGSRCPECSFVYIPPRKNCPHCVTVDTTWIELPPRGVLETFTVIRFSEPQLQPAEPPYAFGIVKLDGADSGLTHFIDEVDFEQLYSGMRMEAVFKAPEKRCGAITDLLYFRSERVEQL